MHDGYACELTYCLHILVRYELEKRIMAGELAVHDLPGEWNRLYKEYLGVDVPDDAHGVLQDTHWASCAPINALAAIDGTASTEEGSADT